MVVTFLKPDLANTFLSHENPSNCFEVFNNYFEQFAGSPKPRFMGTEF